MAFCVKCGKELPEESAVCPFCGSLQGPVDNESDNIPENDKGPKKGKKILRIIVFAISIFIFSELVKFLIIFLGDWFTAWSPERAQNATQAYLDYIFKGDIEHYAEAVGISADVLALQLDEYEEHRASNLIGDEIPVTDTIRENYADFFRNLEKKARYSVGDAVKTDEGFEVQVFVEPIISLANGEFTVLDLLINDSISDAELNERIYTQELELMEQLTAEPAYGDKAEFTVHIAKNENEYAFSNDDISNIYNSYYVVDRHWSEERAKDASEAVFSSIYGSDYDRLADFSVSTKEEIQEIFDEAFSPESEKESFRELYDDRFLEIGYDMNSVSDEIFKSFSDADRAFLAGTKYEILEVTGNEDEYTVRAQITPFDLSQPVVKLNERISSEMGSISDINQYVDRFFSILIEEMNRTVEDHVYAEPFDFELHLKYDENKLYSVDADEFVFLVSIYGQDVGSQQN